MNREGAKSTKEEKEEDTVLPSYSSLRESLRGKCIRGVIIPVQPESILLPF